MHCEIDQSTPTLILQESIVFMSQNMLKYFITSLI